MILGELADYYGQLLDEGKVGKEGWANEKVSYLVTIDYSGQVKSIFSIEKVGVLVKHQSRIIYVIMQSIF